MSQPTEGSSSVTHCSELGAWERVWQRPSRSLRGRVAGYTGYRQRLAAPATHRGIPAPTLRLVISFGPPQRITAPHSAGPTVTVTSFLAGVHDHYVLIDADAHHGIQVDLAPLTAYRLLGRPLRELTAEIVDLDMLFGADGDRLVDDLASAADQAHLANQVRTFTGLSPTQLLARHLPDAGGVFDLDHS